MIGNAAFTATDRPRNTLRLLSVMPIFRPLFSGPSEWWLDFVPFLEGEGIQNVVLTSRCHRGHSLGATDTIGGVPVFRVGSETARSPYLSYVAGVSWFLATQSKTYDVVIFHSPNEDALYAGTLAAHLRSRKVVYRMTLLHEDDLHAIRNVGRSGWLRARIVSHVDGIICVSQPLFDSVDRTKFSKPLLYAPKGVNTDIFRPATRPEKAQLRLSLGIDVEAPTAVFCGSLVHRKGIDILLEAWQQVAARVKDARLLLVGPNAESGLIDPADIAYAGDVQRRVETTSLVDSVRIVGYHRDVSRFFRAADVFVFPSRWEGFGSVIVEAMACGLPIVVSPLDGISRELLGVPPVGAIIEGESAAAYADCITSLFTDNAAAERLGSAGRRRAIEVFDFSRLAGTYANFFREVVGDHGDAQSRRDPAGAVKR